MVAFTDGRKPVANAEIMRRALQYTNMFDRPVFNRGGTLADGNSINDSTVSTRLLSVVA